MSNLTLGSLFDGSGGFSFGRASFRYCVVKPKTSTVICALRRNM